MPESSLQLLDRNISEFCKEFIEHPYLCYTEHGLHALFFARLFNSLPENRRYVSVNGQKVCVVQKEYRTATNLGKSRRQHWDICLIDPKMRGFQWADEDSQVFFDISVNTQRSLKDLMKPIIDGFEPILGRENRGRGVLRPRDSRIVWLRFRRDTTIPEVVRVAGGRCNTP